MAGALPGSDLTPLVENSNNALDREGVMLEFVAELRPQVAFYDATWRAFYTERFKYVVRGDKIKSQPWLLFDLQHDPHEQHNLIEDAQYDAQKAQLHNLLLNRLDETDDPFVLSAAWGCEGFNEWQLKS